MATAFSFWSAAAAPVASAQATPAWIVALCDGAGLVFGSRFFGNAVLALVLGSLVVGLLGVLIFTVYSIGLRCALAGLVVALLASLALVLQAVVGVLLVEYGDSGAPLVETARAAVFGPLMGLVKL